jgi:integrase
MIMDKKIFVLPPTLYPIDRDITKTWFIKYRYQYGKPVKVYGRLAHYATAAEKEAEAKRIIQEIIEPGIKEQQYRDDLTGHLQEWLDNKPMLEKKSRETYQSMLKVFIQWYLPALQADKHACPSGFIKHLFDSNRKKNTIRKARNFLWGAFNALVKAGRYPENPFTDIIINRAKGQSKLPFSAAQIAVLKPLIQKVDPQLWLACQMQYYCFIRPKELRLLKLEDITPGAGMLYIKDDVAKDDDTRAVVIPDQLLNDVKALLTKYPAQLYVFGKDGVPGNVKLSRDALNKRHRALANTLGFGRRYTLYSWVHTGIKAAALTGIPIKQLQMQKGHHSLDMFDRYMKDLLLEENTQIRKQFPTL